MRTPLRAHLTVWVALLGLLPGGWAQALTLGEPRVVNQTPTLWVAEVPLSDLGRIKPEQIQVRLAPPPSWQAAGLQVVDPKTVRISPSPQGGVIGIEIQAPAGFMDLLIELQWPNGRMQRELGLLLGTPSTTVVPHVGVPAKVWVQAGDTASHVVASYLDTTQSMAQGLLALQQANPDAFAGGNVNRLRSGAVLKLPTREEITSIDPQVASEVVAQQIEEFAMYRAELAAQSGSAVPDSGQVATGKVQPAHRDKSETPADRLTLSAPGADGQTDRIAQQRQAQQAADRAAELHRNIQELNRLAQSEGGGMPAPVALPDAPTSDLIVRLVENPLTPWVAVSLVLLLLIRVGWRSMRRNPQPESDIEPGLLVTPLRVDFDLNLPRVDELPPLPAEVLQPPTRVARSTPAQAVITGSPVGANPMAGLSLDLPDLGSGAAAASGPEWPNDPWALRLTLAQALWGRGLTQTALVLAREVAAQAPAAQAQSARVWLDERV